MTKDEFSKLLTMKEPLHPDLEPYVATGPMGKMIHSPLVIEITFIADYCGWINARYLAKKERVQKELEEKNWNTYVFFHERPYRLEAYLRIASQMPIEEREGLALALWIDCENIRQNFGAWKRIWQQIKFEPAKLDAEDREAFDALPDPIPVYRGTCWRASVEGMSWTVDKDKALWFANRFHREGQDKWLVSGVIAKSKIRWAFLTGRNEQEIVAFPKDVKGRISYELNKWR